MASIKLKSNVDRWLFFISLYPVPTITFVINCAILAYATVDFADGFSSDKSLYVIILLFMVNILWQLISTISEARSITKDEGYYFPSIKSETTSYNIDDKCRLRYPEHIDHNGTRVIFNSQINAMLRDASTPINTRESAHHHKMVKEYIDRNKSILLNFFKTKARAMRDGAFFNEKKLCLATEFKSNRDKTAYTVGLSRGRYFNTYITNEIYTLRLTHQSGMDLYPTLNVANYPIKELNESCFENHIGISTIVLTADNMIILMQHNNQVAVSADMLQSTGSGSCIYSDWNKKTDRDLRDSIIRAAHRELAEETGIGTQFDLDTTVIGYYRNLKRGGKPEFCCLTRIDRDSDEIIDAIRVSSDELQDNRWIVRKVDTPADITTLITESSPQISTSLYINLLFLQNYLT